MPPSPGPRLPATHSGEKTEAGGRELSAPPLPTAQPLSLPGPPLGGRVSLLSGAVSPLPLPPYIWVHFAQSDSLSQLQELVF